MAFSFARTAGSSTHAFPLSTAGGRRRATSRRPLRLGATAPVVAPAVGVRDRTVLGVLAILASTVSFPLSDLAAQSLMPALPPIEVAWLRYVVFFLATLPVLLRGRRAVASARPGLQVLRGAMSACSTLAAIVSFKYLPVPETTAISFVAPVVVTGMAVIVLGEKVGLRRWSAALVALLGVLVIVQPGGSSFRLAALIPLVGAVASAAAVIGTRLNKNDAASATLLYSTAVGTLILSGLVAFDWRTPDAAQLEVALVVGGFGALGSLMQVIAYRLAPASLLAPFTFMQLIWAAGFSFLVLGTVPHVGMFCGGAIIAASAVYTALRERAKGIA